MGLLPGTTDDAKGGNPILGRRRRDGNEIYRHAAGAAFNEDNATDDIAASEAPVSAIVRIRAPTVARRPWHKRDSLTTAQVAQLYTPLESASAR